MKFSAYSFMEQFAIEMPKHAAFLPYPVSSLSPPIVPQDLSSFKSRGVSQVERELQEKLREIREQYVAVIDHYNWNKLVYESAIQFEPVVGQCYHLYRTRRGNQLSMISPEQWPQRHLATLRLQVDRQWHVERVGDGVDVSELFQS